MIFSLPDFLDGFAPVLKHLSWAGFDWSGGAFLGLCVMSFWFPNFPDLWIFSDFQISRFSRWLCSTVWVSGAGVGWSGRWPMVGTRSRKSNPDLSHHPDPRRAGGTPIPLKPPRWASLPAPLLTFARLIFKVCWGTASGRRWWWWIGLWWISDNSINGYLTSSYKGVAAWPYFHPPLLAPTDSPLTLIVDDPMILTERQHFVWWQKLFRKCCIGRRVFPYQAMKGKVARGDWNDAAAGGGLNHFALLNKQKMTGENDWMWSSRTYP